MAAAAPSSYGVGGGSAASTAPPTAVRYLTVAQLQAVLQRRGVRLPFGTESHAYYVELCRSQGLGEVTAAELAELAGGLPVAARATDWKEVRSRTDGRVYYHNSRTNETSWQRPAEMDAPPPQLPPPPPPEPNMPVYDVPHSSLASERGRVDVVFGVQELVLSAGPRGVSRRLSVRVDAPVSNATSQRSKEALETPAMMGRTGEALRFNWQHAVPVYVPRGPTDRTNEAYAALRRALESAQEEDSDVYFTARDAATGQSVGEAFVNLRTLQGCWWKMPSTPV